MSADVGINYYKQELKPRQPNIFVELKIAHTLVGPTLTQRDT